MTFAQALNATSVDLGQYQANDSKFILYQGWTDPLIPGYAAVDYWRAVQRADGIKIADFFRLFMAPGMWHCNSGPGPNVFNGVGQAAPPKPGDPGDDALAALTNWVENGVAPAQIIATKYLGDAPTQGVAFQRPLCPYPRHAAYNGSGNPDDAANFECVPNEGNTIIAPAPIYGP